MKQGELSLRRKLAYDAGNHLYTIYLSFVGNEREYVLSKIRFLGKRVRMACRFRMRMQVIAKINPICF